MRRLERTKAALEKRTERRQCALRWVQALITRREQDPVVLPAAAPQVLQLVPLSWNAAGGTLLPVLLPVKPMVTDADGAMVRL
jgi:hypothetical protein